MIHIRKADYLQMLSHARACYPEDIRLAMDPTASYLILSLAENEPVLRAFRIQVGQVSQEELNLE